MVLVCDEDEQTALSFYKLYRRIKRVMPDVRRKLAAISFCDDTSVFAVQVADFIASMVRLDALARHDKKRHDYRKLFKTLTAKPEKHERIWFCGIAKGDKEVLLETAQKTMKTFKKRKLIT